VHVTGFDKSKLPHSHGKADFSPPLNFYINELFFLGLFLGPVWHVRVLSWSLNGSGLTGQTPTWLEITTQLSRKVGYQIGYYL